jgi:class 3 adenylate cyclase
MPRLQLTTKITLLIVIVLIIGFGASTVLTIQRESDLLVEQSKMGARRLIATVVASIETAMLQERPDITRGLIQDLRSSSPVEGITVYRRNGVEAFTDLETLRQVTHEAELPKEVIASIEKMRREPGRIITSPLFTRAVDTMQPQESLDVENGVPLFMLHQPIPNGQKCQGCHGTESQVRAVVRVATSMQPVFAEVRRQRNRQIMVGLLTIATAAGVLALAMRQVVIRPVHDLARVARRIGGGDFEVRAAASSGDEIGELGAALNEMTARLAQAQHELAARNTELATALENLQASRARLEVLEQLKGELSKFVPDAVKELLERDPTATTLEKRTEEVSVLFLDIAGYTRLSEQLEPKRLNQLVQTYFSSFLEIIRAHHGDVNETAGDGLMVIFQDPDPRRHARAAVRAALAIVRRAREINATRGGTDTITLHVGVNSGMAAVGATKIEGSAGTRWTYTASGPVTNIAARLAALGDADAVVVGEETRRRVANEFAFIDAGEHHLRNIEEPVRVYRLPAVSVAGDGAGAVPAPAAVYQ